jgi:hypothetical protein
MAQPFDIVGYTYRAENITPEHLLELLNTGTQNPHTDVEVALDEWANVIGINREDEFSFDSDKFPKVIFRDQLADIESA